MSRLSKILGVKEGQEFGYENKSFICKIEDGILKRKHNENWENISSVLCLMIAHPEKIEIIPQKLQLTEQQITAIKGRIAEGWNWIAKDKDGNIFCYTDRPSVYNGYFNNGLYSSFVISDLFNFVISKNSPIYLPDLIGDENNE